jgi:hypothetical protein
MPGQAASAFAKISPTAIPAAKKADGPQTGRNILKREKHFIAILQLHLPPQLASQLVFRFSSRGFGLCRVIAIPI